MAANTARGRALGSALRAARDSKGITLRALGQLVGRPAGTLSAWETATHRPKPDQVAKVLVALGVTGDEYDEIIQLAYDDEATTWVATSVPSQRAQLQALVNFESSAAKITDVAPSLIPGLLQTGDYIRAIMGVSAPKDEVPARAALRAGRKEVLTRQGSTVQYAAYFGPHTYTYMIGGPHVMAGQLRYVLELAARPNISIRAIRRDAGWYPGLEGAFKLVEFEDQPPLVHIETRASGLFFHDDKDVSAYRRAVGALDKMAHSENETMDLLSNAVRKIERVKVQP